MNGANKLSGAVLAALGLGAFLLSFGVGTHAWGAESARMFPQIVAVVLLVLSLWLTFSPTTDGTELPDRPELVLVICLFLLGAGYTFLIDKFGFLIATFVATPVVFGMFGLRRPLGLLIAAVAVPAALHVVFFELLGLFPPFGAWFDLLDVLRGG